MKKPVKIKVSNTLNSSFNQLLNEVGVVSQDKTTDNIIIVPDRFTLNAERMVFDKLKINATFNIEVLTLTRFINKTLNINGLKVLNKQSSVMQIEKILLENVDKLTTFNKLVKSQKFAETIYETIVQFKSSGVTYNDISNNTQKSGFGEKLKDISLIFNEYEKKLNEIGLDATSRLNLFNNSIPKIERIKKANIFVGMFDSFTNQQIDTLSALAKNCNGLMIGICFNTTQNNKNAFVNETLQSVLNKFNQNDIGYVISNSVSNLTDSFNQINNNLFARKTNFTKIETNQVFVKENEDVTSEINNVASQIKRLVVEDGYDFSNISVAVNSFESLKQLIETSFNEFDLPFYFDTKQNLSENYLSKFVLSLCSVVLKNFDVNEVLQLLKYNLFKFNFEEKCLFENYCLKYGKNFNDFSKCFIDENEPEINEIEHLRKSFITPLLKLKKDLQSCNNAISYLKLIQYYLKNEKIFENYSNLLEENKSNITEVKLAGQSVKKIEELFEEIGQNLGETPISFEYFVQILLSGMEATTLSTVPLKVNSVFVGDASESMFYNPKVLFVLNCVEGAFPNYKMDCGIITDREIENFEAKNQITPSIRLINKREKFKILQLLTLPTEKLVLSYSNMNSGEDKSVSEVVLQIESMFLINGKNLTATKTSESNLINIAFANNEELVKNFAYILGTRDRALKFYLKNLDKNYLLKAILNEYFKHIELNQSKSVLSTKNTDLFFKNATTTISEIERYFNCPYVHFLDYGLKVKEREIYEISPLDIGNILHRVAEVFVNKLIEQKFDIKDVKNLVKDCFNMAINEQKVDKFVGNKFQLKNLEQEAQRLCNAILNQINSSEFKPVKTEFSFADFKINEKIKINGKVDRIDEYNNYTKLIDYKTGQTKFDYSNIYYGKKIQLPIYAYVTEKLLKKNTASMFYFPSKNSFYDETDGEMSPYKLSGIYLNEEPIIKALDTNLKLSNKSLIFKAEYTKADELNSNSKKFALSPKEFKNLLNYSIKVLLGAVEEINKGTIKPYPLKDSCKFCPYYSICKFNVEKMGYRACENKVEKDTFNFDKQKEAE